MRSLKLLAIGLLLLPLGALAQTANCVPKYTSITPQYVLACSTATDNGTTFAITDAVTAPSFSATTSLTTPSLTINSGAAITVPSVANIQIAMPATAIAANTCTAYTATTDTGVQTTSTITFQNATDDTGVTGWDPTAPSLTIDKYPTLNTVNWRVCNSTNASITPSPITMNASAK